MTVPLETTEAAPPPDAPQPNAARRVARRRPIGAAIVTTAIVTAISYGLPASWSASGVGLAFIAVTSWLVLREDAEITRHFGLSLGGLLEPAAISSRQLLCAATRACAWALGLAAIVFPFFAAGFRWYWGLSTFHLRWPPDPLDELAGQLLVVALPEEAFYRGYLMTSLDDRWGVPLNIGGAKVGWGLVVSSVIFAVGHVCTEPDPGRLAVFFPALLFGWLRARTGGVEAGVVFHTLCNLFASTLVRGFG